MTAQTAAVDSPAAPSVPPPSDAAAAPPSSA